MPRFLSFIRALLLALGCLVARQGGAVVWTEVDTAGAEEPEVRPAMPFSIEDMADDVDIFAEAYMQPSYDDPIVDIGIREFNPSYSVNPYRNNSVDFTTGEQRFLCANINWKWLCVGYAFPLADYTHGYDFSFSPRIANFKLDLGVSNIKNYLHDNPRNYRVPSFEENPAGEEPVKEEVRLDGLETFEWNCNLEWILNKTYFSASSAFSQSYSCGQRVSAGSMLCGVAFGENRFGLKPGASRSEKADSILSLLPMTNNRIYNLSLGCGYGYNFVVRQGRFVVGLLFVPYVAGAKASYRLHNQAEDHFCFGVRGHGRLNLAYQYRLGFVTVATNWKGLYFNDSYFSYLQSQYSVDVNFAFKLGEFGLHHKKIPGHKIIDFVDRILSNNE